MKKMVFAAFAVAFVLAGASAAEAHGHKGHRGHHHHGGHMRHKGVHHGHSALWSHGHSRLKHCAIHHEWHDGNYVMTRTC
ncbi:MAG: hypothetical protein ABJA10_08920 [Aestuariivirga sp.]